MTTPKKNEKRNCDRRPETKPVTFFADIMDRAYPGYGFGHTCDVSPLGARIRARHCDLPEVGQHLILVVSHRQNIFPGPDSPVRIKGEVAWNNGLTRHFGIKFDH